MKQKDLEASLQRLSRDIHGGISRPNMSDDILKFMTDCFDWTTEDIKKIEELDLSSEEKERVKQLITNYIEESHQKKC